MFALLTRGVGKFLHDDGICLMFMETAWPYHEPVAADDAQEGQADREVGWRGISGSCWR